MDVDFELAEDFIFLLELCKDPEKVFAQNSSELAIARTWLDKLSRYDCTNLEERRLRNVYMSHLIVCLNEGKLAGPFATKPNPGKLETTDFSAKSKVCIAAKCSPACGSRGVNTSAGNDSFPDDPHNAEDNECHCKDRPCKCCKCKDRDSDAVVNYVTQHVKTPACMYKYETETKIPETSSTPITLCKSSASSAIRHERPTPAEFHRLQQHVSFLLEAIAAELRGEIEPGTNDYLEHELSRYKKFITNYSTMAVVLDRLQSKPTMRSFLLLNLQNDLVKLLNDTINNM